ncbi:HAMP domain-containing histidine kinase [Kineosporiaceae bacterium SCSIO 59966]|nr:HAMP domain-containing histidine kinase [Kineosporiaceae bacterium SCSIO 59966]
MGPRRAAWWGLGGAGLGLMLHGLSVVLSSHIAADDVRVLAAALWSGASLSSGLLLLVVWRLTGRVPLAYLALGLVVIGVAPTLALWVLALTADDAARVVATGFALAGLYLLGGMLLRRSVLSPEVDTSFRLRRAVTLNAAAAVTVVAVSITVLPALGHLPSSPLLPALPLAAVLAVVTGVLVMTMRRTSSGVWLLALLVPATLAVTVVLWSGGPAAGAAGDVLLLAGSAVVAGYGYDALRGALTVQGARSLSAMASLSRYVEELAEDRRRRHDARSAVSAIRAASSVLTSSGAELDEATRRQLAEAVRAELSRVERLLTPDTHLPNRVVDVARVLAPVAATWRHRGLEVTDPPSGVLAVAQPDAVAEIVGNLLDNAYRHAPGSPVVIDATVRDGTVVVEVRDDGPGIPADQVDAVFDSGVTLDSGSPGQGLGLPSARALAESQGGVLRLHTAPGCGCRFVLELPAASRPGRLPGTLDVERVG